MATVDRNVFVSYCHEDDAWLKRLKVHLRPLIRQGVLDVWDDTKISPGLTWREEIKNALSRARVAVLLVSADFLASDFAVDTEIPKLLHRAADGGVLILPVVIGPCLFREHEELSRYQCVNSPEKPLASMTSADSEAILVSLARSIDKYFRFLDSKTTLVDERVAIHGLPGEAVRSAPVTTTPASDPPTLGPLVVPRPINLGFDGATVDGIPVGWFNSFGHVGGVSTEYDIRVRERSHDRATGSCAELRKNVAGQDEFGSLMQRCAGRFLAGKTVRLEGELQSKDLTGWAGLWLRADADDQPDLFFDNMSRRPIMGTTPWTHYFIDAPLPLNTDWLNYGIVLSGAGVLSADNLRLLVWTGEGRWEDV
jgi:hypothetical protein